MMELHHLAWLFSGLAVGFNLGLLGAILAMNRQRRRRPQAPGTVGRRGLPGTRAA